MQSSFSVLMLIAVATRFSVALQNMNSTNPSFQTRLNASNYKQAVNFTKNYNSNSDKNVTINRTEASSSTPVTIITHKISLKEEVFKRHAFGIKNEEPQKQEQGIEKPSEEVNKADETQNKNNEKLLNGLQNNVKEEWKHKETSKKLSDAHDIASKVHVHEEQEEKRKKKVFARLNDQVEIGKHIVDSAKEIKKHKFEDFVDSSKEIKKHKFDAKKHFIGPDKEIGSSETHTLAENKNNMELDKSAKENSKPVEGPGQEKREVNNQSPIKRPDYGEDTVKTIKNAEKSSLTDETAFIGKEVERLGHILAKTDETKHVDKKSKHEEMKSVRRGKNEVEAMTMPTKNEDNKNASQYIREEAKDAVSEIKPESIQQVAGSNQVKENGKQSKWVSDILGGVEKKIKGQNVTESNKQIGDKQD